MREKNINFVRSLKVKHNISKKKIMQLQQIPAYPDTAPACPAHAHVLVTVTGGTVVGTNEKRGDLEWACGVTGGCQAGKVRERQWEFISNTKHFVSGVI